jgi:hypothetical protein
MADRFPEVMIASDAICSMRDSGIVATPGYSAASKKKLAADSEMRGQRVNDVSAKIFDQ